MLSVCSRSSRQRYRPKLLSSKSTAYQIPLLRSKMYAAPECGELKSMGNHCAPGCGAIVGYRWKTLGNEVVPKSLGTE